ncbi:flagellin [Fontivita pretiosa]|uniref:flagellin N-terminal helical domain-containing protein n=1 Tax=Fontivita pretiosa TaxID=2989684 RepID=UPI003D169722
MARINTNVASLTAQRGLAKTHRTLNDTLQRLSTGLRINRGADDPAGLIASEGLRSEISGINQAIDNSQRASNVIATAEGALQEVAALLLNIKDLVVEAANVGALSPEEIAANQLQIDSAVESITRISNTTTFAGLKLLNGNLDYLTSGVATSAIKALHISQANFGTTGEPIPVQIEVITSAEPAVIQFRASAVSGGSVTLEITGNEGVDVLTFTSGTTASAIAFAVNRITDSTGVRAELINSANAASGIAFVSSGYGSKSFVSVRAQSGSFTTVDSDGNSKTRTVGVDAVATINGALTVGDGLNIKLNSAALDIELTLDEQFGIGSTSFAITGGGALFQLGPQVSTNQQVNIGIQSVAASKLGDEDVGFLNDIVTGGPATLVGRNAAQASKIVERAIREVAVLRGRLGAFEKNTLQTNINSLSIALENVTASESSIRDADFAAETAALTRAQILTQAGTSVLATANATPQTVLSLLGG